MKKGYPDTSRQKPGQWWLVLKLSVCISLLGQAYAHFFSGPPYRAVFYEQSAMQWLTDLIGLSWEDYINDPVTDARLDMVIYGFGTWILTGALCAMITPRGRRSVLFSICAVILAGSSLLLAFLAFNHYLDAGLQFAQLFEYSLQALSPLLLIVCALGTGKKVRYAGLALIAITFASHGLYALGYYPVPGNFIDMVSVSLGLENDAALSLLLVAGIADLIIAVLLFIPQTRKFALVYCVVWGVLTSAARLTTYVYPGSLFWLTFHQTLPLFLVRVVHFGVPLAWFLLEGAVSVHKTKGSSTYNARPVA